MAITKVSDLVGQAKGKIENLNCDQVQKELESGALLVDLREADEREAEGVIPQAIHVPRGMLEFVADPSSPYHRAEFGVAKRIVVHCAKGGRSALAADTLRRMGFDAVAHLDGGFEAWKTDGRPVARVR